MSGLVLLLMFVGGIIGFRASFSMHLKKVRTEVADVI